MYPPDAYQHPTRGILESKAIGVQNSNFKWSSKLSRFTKHSVYSNTYQKAIRPNYRLAGRTTDRLDSKQQQHKKDQSYHSKAIHAVIALRLTSHQKIRLDAVLAHRIAHNAQIPAI